ncbi:MAG: restriction endonuclease [Candidatus Gastranaerophilales bacterium]|nr:restriction endonuclease [Candidatus Gastranaerophilales bacterium]
MARRGDYRSFYELVAILVTLTVTILTVLFRFLKEVYRYNLWGDLFKSLLVAFFGFCVVVGIAEVSPEIAGITALAEIIYFCIWWHKKFSYADTRLNSLNWREQAWWWTLDGWQFEHEVARVFRLNGFKATVTKGSGDGGVDIILKKDGYCAIVQCKHHQYPLSPEPVRALWGIKDDWGADEVIMVASSGLTSASVEFVRNKANYKVLNLDDIIRLSQCALQKEQQQKVQQSQEQPQEPKQQAKIIKQITTVKKQATSGRKVDF